MDIQYIGEHLMPGRLGHLAVTLSFVFALLSALLYAFGQKKEGLGKSNWLPRAFFIAHVGLFVFAAATLFYMIFNHYFEYRYVWQYSSKEMATKFVISCFWAGQQGSFFVWGVWQGLLGLVVLLFVKDWESPVMAVIALAQVFLASMLLGTEIGGFSIGANPFELLRDTAGPNDAEFFANPDYLSFIQDGNGLNPLLENYWMVIHPPILFLGYASLLIPFAYAMAGLWTKRYRAWVKEVRPWVLFSGAILGLGILLGGAWAYVALTFGGFWAWDPVENASLVPWLTLIAAMHFIMAGRNHNLSHLAAFVFTSFAYVMVLYASFLTRSGILTETSVHSFGDDGLMMQLVGFVVVFFLISIGLFIFRYKDLAKKEKENVLSREFWLFIGAMVIVLSVFQITFSTSIPVINLLFGTNIAPPLNPVDYYNGWQLPYAFLIALLIGFTQYLSFGGTRGSGLWKKLLPAIITGLILTVVTVTVFEIGNPSYMVLLFALFFAMSSAVAWWARKGFKLSKAGALITHFGFALFLVGVVITFSNEIVISKNTSQSDLSSIGSNQENQLLVFGDTVPMGPYVVTYTDRWKEGTRTHFKVDFLKRDKDGGWEHSFTLEPNINENTRMGNVYEPATVNHLDKDVYAYLSYADLAPKGMDTYPKIREAEVAKGDSVRIEGLLLIIDSLTVMESDPAMENVWLKAFVRIVSPSGSTAHLEPEYRIHNDLVGNEMVTGEGLGFSVRFERVSDLPGAIWLGLYKEQKDMIVMKAIIFPYINILWLGSIIMLLGFCVAFVHRIKPKH